MHDTELIHEAFQFNEQAIIPIGHIYKLPKILRRKRQSIDFLYSDLGKRRFIKVHNSLIPRILQDFNTCSRCAIQLLFDAWTDLEVAGFDVHGGLGLGALQQVGPVDGHKQGALICIHALGRSDMLIASFGASGQNSASSVSEMCKASTLRVNQSMTATS